MKFIDKRNPVFQPDYDLHDSWVTLFTYSDVLHHTYEESNTGVVNGHEELTTLVFKTYAL